jgi:hypothetical protein
MSTKLSTTSLYRYFLTHCGGWGKKRRERKTGGEPPDGQWCVSCPCGAVPDCGVVQISFCILTRRKIRAVIVLTPLFERKHGLCAYQLLGGWRAGATTSGRAKVGGTADRPAARCTP